MEDVAATERHEALRDRLVQRPRQPPSVQDRNTTITMKSVQVTVSPEGEVVVEALGFKGKGCKAATEAIEKAVGVSSKTTPKPEYNAAVQQQVGA